MKILFLSPRKCVPVRSGAKLRDFYFARALGEGAELTYAYFSPIGEPALTHAELPFCVRIVSVDKPAGYGALQVARAAIGSTPLPVLNYASDAMFGEVQRLTEGTRYDLIHVDSIHMYQYAHELRRTSGAHIVCNWHNIESEAMQRFAETVQSTGKRLYARLTARKIQRLELQMLENSLGHVVCSLREMDALQTLVPGARIQVAENGVDTTYFDLHASATGETVRLVFVGSMDYFPNADGALAFVEHVWPALVARFPNATLQIVGANPGPDVRGLSRVSGVTVTGTVDDVRPYYRGATAAIVPLRTGGGTRLKILEAMASGVPVISTALGAEGLSVTSGTNILLAAAGAHQQWIKHIETVVERSAIREALVANGRSLVVGKYDWNGIGQRLLATYRNWLTAA